MNKSTTTEHGFKPMEQFLIDFCKKHSKGRLYNINLEEHFGKYPLDKERYDKINVSIGRLRNYDVICAKYGIETEKLDHEQYAAKHNISEEKAEKLFEDVTKYLTRDYATELYYMAVDPKLIRRYIFETQFELHNMMRAYDSLTGKNTAYEHHVGLCDGSTLGRDLFNEGFDTLEEVQKESRVITPHEDGPYGIDTRVLVSRAYSISKTLDFYGLKNDLWRGSLQVVFGSPFDDNHPPIYAIEDYGEVKIFFRTKKIRVDEGAMKDILNGLVYNNNCSGYDIARLCNGDIWIYFNPTIHKACDRRRAIDKVAEELNKSALCLEEEDIEYETENDPI